MAPKLFSNKYFIFAILAIFFVYAILPKITLAGGQQSFLGWILTGLAIALTIVAAFFCYGCTLFLLLESLVAVTTVGGALTTGAIVALALNAVSISMSIATTVGLGLCLSGQSNPFYTGCEGTAPPDVKFLGTGGKYEKAPPPVVTDSTTNCTANSIKLCYSVKDAYQYAIYKNKNLIPDSKRDACLMPDGSPYNFCYTDTNVSPGVSYDYELLLTDVYGQQLLFPEETLKATNTCK